MPFLGTDHMKPYNIILLCTTALLATSCMTIRETSNTYVLPAGSTASLAGATIAGEFIPKDGSSSFNASAMVYGVASGKRFGPYEFALYATGHRQQHDNITVHSLTYRWSSGVTDVVPAAYMGRAVNFRNTLDGGVIQATWHSPGELRSDFAKETSVTVEADVTVKTRTGSERRKVSLKFDRATVKNTSFHSAPLEMAKQVRRGGVPFEDLDIGANRGDWKPR